ncbi:hypothetical protein [Nocardioides acrostichi]|uniref:Uncharacterized protein n=1 Tax=Nocardioides acrostichi TaxID=2784339 RepID=A0A930UUX8_9ACTN|nr:hypothetical protein [Nocardioides acrostichi]MBF4160646.1 hypothetical protein [Nocardioides acrostichi]
MSKERQRRRAAREHEAALLVAARAAEAERAERAAARKAALTGWIPKPVRTARPTGALAERRRRQVNGVIAALLAVNVLLAVVFTSLALSAFTAVISLLAAPVLYTLLFR